MNNSSDPKKASTNSYHRQKELKAFDDTKTGVKGLVDAGVKGLVDAGVLSVPRIFIRSPEDLSDDVNTERINRCKLPVIDLNGIERSDRRKEIVDEIRYACENWGFFQVINHEVPVTLTEKMIAVVKEFHEQDSEMKKEYYSRDRTKNKVVYSTSSDLYFAPSAPWRDTLCISLQTSHNLHPNELPSICRDTTIEFIDNVRSLGKATFGLLSEALGLKTDHLESTGCDQGCTFVCHYYPPCPQPDLVLGATKHSDPSFLTLLLQDQIGGLQILHQNQWVDVAPLQGAFVVNIGDFIQMLTNDKFKSVQHRVLANLVGPRISVACFFNGLVGKPQKIYGVIKELISNGSPPLYKDFEVMQYVGSFKNKGGAQKSGLDYFKL